MMYMPVDIIRDVPDLIRPHRNVCTDKVVFLEQAPQLNLLERCIELGVFDIIVVAQDQTLLAFQTSEDRRVTERDVPEMVDLVAGLHDRVPAVDHQLVHFLNGTEGTDLVAGVVKEVKEILVSKMSIGREPDIRHLLVASEYCDSHA